MKSILLGLDLADPHRVVIDKAADVARTYDARLRIVYVAPPDPSFLGSASWPQEVRDSLASELKEEHTMLADIAESLRTKGIAADSLMMRGHVIETLANQINRIKPEMAILGSKMEGGLLQTLGGGVVRGVVKKSGCPVLVIPIPPSEEEELCEDEEESPAP